MRSVTLGVVVAMLLVIVPAASAQTPTAQPQVDADIQRLMDLTGASKTGPMIASLVSTQMLQQLRQQHPDVPPRAVDIVKSTLDEQFRTAFAPDGPLMHDLAAIWSKRFTHEEILGLITFYETPLGRKIIEATPEIAREGAQAGAAWAQQAMPEIQKKIEDRLRAEGLIK